MTSKENGSKKPRSPKSLKTLSKPGPRTTKKARLVRLLRGRHGVSTDTISKRLGWQPHTTRAALSGLRKSGFVIEKMFPPGGGPTRYAIVKDPDKSSMQ